MDDVVDTGNLVFTGDAEAHGLLDCETQDQGDNEGVEQHGESGNRLYRELTEVATGEQARVDGEESEVQGSNKA